VRKTLLSFLLFKCIIIISFIFFSCKKEQTTAPVPDLNAKKILFIGSSYFNYNNLPGLFEGLAKANGKNVFVDGAILNGVYLDYHASNSGTAAKIKMHEWDYIFLQGVCTNAAFPETHQVIFPPYQSHPLVPSIQTLQMKIHANYENTVTVYSMPWAFEDGTTWLNGFNHSYDDMQVMIYTNTIQFSGDLGFKISPVGWAWRTVIKERQDIKLFMSDYNHPTLRGSYLTACVFYVTVFQESVEGVSYYGNVSESTALYLQKVATSTVLNNLNSWN